jgi:hypothetical protein
MKRARISPFVLIESAYLVPWVGRVFWGDEVVIDRAATVRAIYGVTE